jgi:hypothetical protein
MMEAVRTSETSSTSTWLHGATAQKTLNGIKDVSSKPIKFPIKI